MGAHKHGPPSTKNIAGGVGRGILGGLLDEGKSWVRFTLAGAVVGSVGLGGVVAYHFGLEHLLLGAGIGAAVGGVGAGLLYLFAAAEL
ncbi:MAG: hypothetical protein AAGE01_12230 [Pseudomonadota bacterium]